MTGTGRPEVVAEYTYQDAAALPVILVKKWVPGQNNKPKSFSQHTLNDHGEWVSGLNGREPVLYHLPEVLEPEHSEILVVEGEKDADNLQGIGFIATTNPMGAGKWLPQYTEALKGKDVAIIPDNDKDGRNHAAKVAAATYGVARSVKIVNLPGLGEKEDVSDFIEKHGRDSARTQLTGLIETAEKYEPDCYLERLSTSDDDGIDEYTWLVEKLVPEKEPMIIGGKGSAGKSTLALEFSHQILESDPKATVVYMCAEGTYKDTKIKARKMGLTSFERFFFMKRKGGATSFKLSDDRDLELVSRTLQRAKKLGHQIAFVVIDSIRGMQKGSLNDDAVGEVMQAVNSEICQRLGATVCYIHHSKKNVQDVAAMDAMLGSVFIVNSTRHVLLLRKKTSKMRTVEVCKSNLGYEDHWWTASMNDNHRIELSHEGDLNDDGGDVDQTQIDKAEELLLQQLGQGEAVAAAKIYETANFQGISADTMKRAKKIYVVRTFRQTGRWFWQMSIDQSGNPRVRRDLK